MAPHARQHNRTATPTAKHDKDATSSQPRSQPLEEKNVWAARKRLFPQTTHIEFGVSHPRDSRLRDLVFSFTSTVTPGLAGTSSRY